MDNLSENARKLIFVVVAILLVGLGGINLAGGGETDDSDGPEETVRTLPPIQPAPAPADDTPDPVQPEDLPSQIPDTDDSDIVLDYQLPLEDGDIVDAAEAAASFIENYVSYSYQQNNQTWVSSLELQLSRQPQVDMESIIPNSIAAAELNRTQTVTEGSAQSVSVLLLSESTVVLDVDVKKTTTDTSGETESVSSYTVSMVDEAGRWKVQDAYLSDGKVISHSEGS